MEIDAELSELIGIHIGDGCLSNNGRYHEWAISGDINEEREYYENFVIPLANKKIIKPILNRNIKGKKYPKSGVFGFYIFKKEINEFFYNLGLKPGEKTEITIPELVLTSEKNIKSVLRGLFDTDGTFYLQKRYSGKERINKVPVIKLGSTSKKLILQVYNLLIKMDFKPFLKKPYLGKRDKNKMYSVVIHRKLDIEKWFFEIGFNNNKHKTKYEIWKKLGYCPPNTTIKERKKILKQKTL